VSQVPAKGPPILLEAGKGTLIRLPRPAATVFIANPDVADVQVKSPSMIYVNAKTPGETVLYAVDADDNVLLNAPIRVEHDVSRLRESLHALIPGENVAVESVDGSLVLKGNVSSARRAPRGPTLSRPRSPARPKAKSSTSCRLRRRTKSICGSRSPKSAAPC
jgi:pilus assembly protein CpaC